MAIDVVSRHTAFVPASDDLHPQLIATIAERTRATAECLGTLSEEELCLPSDLPEWSRLTIACHLRYGAKALCRMSHSALAHRPVSYYPEGRQIQRARTLVPLPDESPLAVVESLARHSEELHQLWSSVDAGDWGIEVVEPPDRLDLGPIPLGRLPLLRLTEVEVHGSDLGLALADWSELFVHLALPMRLEWLNTRRANHRAFDANLDGSWLLVAADGPTYRVSVSVRGSKVESVPASPTAAATARITATSRDLLALLLGRPGQALPVITGDTAFGQAFPHAFPGP